MATLNLGRIKPVFKGAWTSGAFVIDDIVTHGNETFICIQAGTNKATSDASYWTKLAAKGTDGTDLTSTITTQGDILFRDGSGLQRLAKGTAAQTLKMNSGATAPEWTTVAAASTDFVKLATVTATGSATTVAFDGHFTSDYLTYEMIGTGIYGASNMNLRMRFNQSGSAVSSSSYRTINILGYRNSGGQSTDTPGSWSDSTMRIYYNDSGSDTHGSANIRVQDPLNTNTYHHATWHGGYAQNGEGGEMGATHGVGMWNGNKNALSGITLYNANGGNMYGTYKLYGIK
tara:strand:- start:171 stop:1034 length:864 start_codon:yes stop_codon:yes gene_type:complete